MMAFEEKPAGRRGIVRKSRCRAVELLHMDVGPWVGRARPVAVNLDNTRAQLQVRGPTARRGWHIQWKITSDRGGG
ncbi:hypothetical protein [Paraburkholderia caffeinilytica]|uniref:hypothetical protein n=1 Tax=Paraburkholderia caffeinilytica TaxID=1761016 RepID=UPI003D9FEC5B